MEIKIWNLVADTDNGTDVWSYTNPALAEKDFVDLINEYLPDYGIPPADTYEEARDSYDLIIDRGCIDTIYVQETKVSFGPTPPAPDLVRFYVTMAWENFPEGGSYGDVVWARDHGEAEDLVRKNMAYVRCEGVRPEDYHFYDCETFEQLHAQFLQAHQHQWEVIDCWRLDDFIENNLVA